MGVRESLPCLLIQINRDQECYDFMKWWIKDKSDYDWGNNTLPYLDMKGEDLLEPVMSEFLRSDSWTASVQFYAAYVLLKYRALSTLKMIQKYDLFLLGKCMCLCDVCEHVPEKIFVCVLSSTVRV